MYWFHNSWHPTITVILYMMYLLYKQFAMRKQYFGVYMMNIVLKCTWCQRVFWNHDMKMKCAVNWCQSVYGVIVYMCQSGIMVSTCFEIMTWKWSVWWMWCESVFWNHDMKVKCMVNTMSKCICLLGHNLTTPSRAVVRLMSSNLGLGSSQTH